MSKNNTTSLHLSLKISKSFPEMLDDTEFVWTKSLDEHYFVTDRWIYSGKFILPAPTLDELKNITPIIAHITNSNLDYLVEIADVNQYANELIAIWNKR